MESTPKQHDNNTEKIGQTQMTLPDPLTPDMPLKKSHSFIKMQEKKCRTQDSVENLILKHFKNNL
jgi:hypothetical protein